MICCSTQIVVETIRLRSNFIIQKIRISHQCHVPYLSSVKPSADVGTRKSYELEAYSLMVIDCNAHAKGLM